MAEQETAQQQPELGASDLSTANQPAGTTRIDDGIAYDVTGKALGSANVPGEPAQPSIPQQPVDLVAAAKAAGATQAPPQPVDLVAAAKAAGATPAPSGKTAPEQSYDLLTKMIALARPSDAAAYLTGDQTTKNSALAQAKNVSDYIYNNILGKDTYTHNNLTYDQKPSSFMGKVWQRLWGWATQDEINKIPGLEPDRVAALQQTGNDILGSMFGKDRADQLREHILNGSYVVNVPPEDFARAAAKSLTDYFSPGYYALGAFGRVAQGYQKASQVAANVGDMVAAARAMGKARLLGLLGTGVNIPFTISQAHDLVENWDGMNVPERVASISGILGGAINTHIGIKAAGGYSEVAGDVKDTATVAGRATKKALGAASDKVLQAAPDFVTAIERASQLTGRKYAEQKANIRAVAPELQAIINENPNLEGSPQKLSDAIHEWLQQREQVLLGASGGTKDSDVPVSSTLEADIRDRLGKFFSSNRGKYGNDQQVEEATQKIISRLMLSETAQGQGPAALRMPNAFEAENARQGLNNEVKPQIGGEPTTNAYRAAAHETVKQLRESIDKFYHNNGIENVKEFRQKEGTLIDVADRLALAQKRADELGNGSLWSSLAKKYKDPFVLATILVGSHLPAAFGGLAPYLVGEKVYNNYKNPGVNIRRAIELSNPNAVPTDISQNPAPIQGASFPPGGPGAIRPPAGPSLPPGGPGAIRLPAGPVMPSGGLPTPPAHPTQAASAAAAVAPATMAAQPTNHQLNAQLATHFGEPLNHEVDGQSVSLEDRIEQVKTDAEAMRRSGVDISKTQTGKMLGLINEHEQLQAAAIEKEQEKAHEDAKKVSEELHQEFQKLQEEQKKKAASGKSQPNQDAAATAAAAAAKASTDAEGFKVPYTTTDEELPQSEAEKGRAEYTPFNTRLHELGHAVWSHLMGLRPFDVVSGTHEAGEGAHAVARTDISRFLHPDGRMNTKAVLANLGDVITRFLAGGIAEEVHGGIPFDKNTSVKSDLNAMNKMFDRLEIPKDQREPIIQQAKAQLREEFTKPGMEELMKGFSEKRKAGLSPDYHFDETQMHQLGAALDKLKKGGNNEPNKPEPKGGNAPGAKQQASGVGGESDAGRKGTGASEIGRLQQTKPQSGLVEESTGNEDHDAAIRNGGGIPAGSVHVPGHGPYKSFHDPETGSMLTFKPSDAITPQTVGKKIAASRAEIAASEDADITVGKDGGESEMERLRRNPPIRPSLVTPRSPAVTPEDIIKQEGLNYKGELIKGSGVHMFEHPDHPGKTSALQAPFTVEDVRNKVKEKAEANMVSSKELEDRIQKEKADREALKVQQNAAASDDFSKNPGDFIDKDYLPQDSGSEPAMYHVTTAKDKVLSEGLKSRKQTGGAGLGGGYNNQSPDKVSVTFDEGHANLIADRMRLAAQAARGEITSQQALDAVLSSAGIDDDEPRDVAKALGAPEETHEDWDKFNEWFDKNYKNEDAYSLVQELDDAMPEIFSGSGDPVRVGLTAPKSKMAKINPDQIHIFQVEAKRGAKSEHIPDEAELRFHPDDVRIVKDSENLLKTEQNAPPKTIPPQTAWDNFGPKQAPGMLHRGNIDISHRPVVKNDDGTHSSEYSFSFMDDDGHEVLVPTVVDGKFLTPDGKKPKAGSAEEKAMFHKAMDHYYKTGQRLGIFDSSKNADAYANAVHNRKQ